MPKVDRTTVRSKELRPPVWEGEDYPHIEPGRRMVRVHKLHGPEWVRAFSRWSLRVECHLMDEPGW